MTYLLAAVLPMVLLFSASPAGGVGEIAIPSNGEAVSTSQVFSPQFMGMHMLSPTRHWPTVPFGAVRPAGTTWGFIEKDKGIFDWHSVDTWVAAALAHGVQLDYVFLNTPQWASTRPSERCNRGPIGCAAPPDDADWKQFVTALVTRYKGKIASYEMWNEPNAIGFFTGTPADMAHLVSLAYPIIKSIDPNAIVVSPAPSSTGWPTPYDKWLDEYFKAGGGRYTDVVAWHAYAGRTTQPASPPEDVAAQINKVRTVMDRHGLSGVPLWDTEGGWGNDSQLPDERAQADFLMRWYLIQFTHGVARVYWYQWDNPVSGTLWREGTGETPAGKAYGQVYGWLDGTTSSTPCAPAKGSTWTCRLTKGPTSYLAAWSTSGSREIPAEMQSAGRSRVGESRDLKEKPAVEVSSTPVLLSVR